MPGALLGILEHRRKAGVELATLCARCTRVQNGCQERMRKAHAFAVDLEHTRINRLVESVVGAGCPCSGTHEVDRRPPQHRDDEADGTGR